MCEKYNGWANRETWALQLWIDNDQGLSDLVEERVREMVAEYTPGEYGWPDTAPDYYVGEAVKGLWEELTDPSEGLMSADKILEMVRDIGSEYRISWDEIGAAWLATISEDES